MRNHTRERCEQSDYERREPHLAQMHDENTTYTQREVHQCITKGIMRCPLDLLTLYYVVVTSTTDSLDE